MQMDLHEILGSSIMLNLCRQALAGTHTLSNRRPQTLDKHSVNCTAGQINEVGMRMMHQLSAGFWAFAQTRSPSTHH